MITIIYYYYLYFCHNRQSSPIEWDVDKPSYNSTKMAMGTWNESAVDIGIC